MKTYRVEDILTSFGIFLDEVVEAENMSIDIELEEVEEEEGDE